MHPCGNWHDRMDLVAQNQADCYFLGPMDIRLCVDKITEQNKAGKARCKAMNGNIGAATPSTTDGKTALPYASTLNQSTPEQIEAESKEVIKVTEDSGLRCILGPNCWAPAQVPFVNIDTVTYSARKYGTFAQ